MHIIFPHTVWRQIAYKTAAYEKMIQNKDVPKRAQSHYLRSKRTVGPSLACHRHEFLKDLSLLLFILEIEFLL